MERYHITAATHGDQVAITSFLAPRRDRGPCAGSRARDAALWRWRAEAPCDLWSTPGDGLGQRSALRGLVAREVGTGRILGVMAGVALPAVVGGARVESIRLSVAEVAARPGNAGRDATHAALAGAHRCERAAASAGARAADGEDWNAPLSAEQGRRLIERMGQAWCARHLGRGRAAFALEVRDSAGVKGSGSPLARATRLGAIRLLEHARVEELYELGPRFEAVELHSPPADADLLWDQVQRELALAVVRDQRYLEWRYDRHPWHRYVIVAVRGRRAEGTRGIAILAPAPGAHDAWLALEWIVAGGDPAGAEALIGAAARSVARRGARVLGLWLPPGRSQRRVPERLGFRTRATTLAWTGRMGDSALSTAELLRMAYASLGDSELF